MNRHGSDVSHGKDAKPGGVGKPAAEASSSDPASERLLPSRGDYQTLLSFQKAEVVYDITFRFAHKHLARSDRTIDQMSGTEFCGTRRAARAHDPCPHRLSQHETEPTRQPFNLERPPARQTSRHSYLA